MVPQKSLKKALIPIVVIAGPTATGKSSLVIELALQNNQIEIINADSMLVYKGMNIGTAKPSQEEQRNVPHHLIDIKNPDETFTAGEFKRAADEAIESIHSRGKRAVIVGGTGFYLKSLLFGLWSGPASDPELRKRLNEQTNESLYESLQAKDPPSALRIGTSDRYRLIRAMELILLTDKSLTELQAEVPEQPDPRFKLWIVDRPNEDLYSRIQHRTTQMLKEGLVEEFKRIQAKFPGSRALTAIGYAQVADHLAGILPKGRKIKEGLEGLQSEIELATRQLVKRQRTWFRNQSAKTPDSRWFHLDHDRIEFEIAFNSLYSEQTTEGHL